MHARCGACIMIMMQHRCNTDAIAGVSQAGTGRGIRRERIRPTRRYSHGGRSDEPTSRARIAPALRDRFKYLKPAHSPRSAVHRRPLQKFESALDVQWLGNRGQPRELRRYNAPHDPRAIPKAPHGAFAAISYLYGDVGFDQTPRGLYP